jgi:hypothetical protein
LEKEGQARKDLKITKSDIVAALDSSEFETRIILNELDPTSPSENKLSDDLRNGLQWGHVKMLRRFVVLEQLTSELREQGFFQFKDRAHKIFAKL